MTFKDYIKEDDTKTILVTVKNIPVGTIVKDKIGLEEKFTEYNKKYVGKTIKVRPYTERWAEEDAWYISNIPSTTIWHKSWLSGQNELDLDI